MLIAGLVCTTGLMVLTSCAAPAPSQTIFMQQVVGGDPQEGRRLIYQYACGSCHVIPGVRGADGTVGPPLSGLGSRQYVAGSLPNTPDNLHNWIRNPQQIEPGTAMPDLGVSEEQGWHIATYLYTLRELER